MLPQIWSGWSAMPTTWNPAPVTNWGDVPSALRSSIQSPDFQPICWATLVSTAHSNWPSGSRPSRTTGRLMRSVTLITVTSMRTSPEVTFAWDMRRPSTSITPSSERRISMSSGDSRRVETISTSRKFTPL